MMGDGTTVVISESSVSIEHAVASVAFSLRFFAIIDLLLCLLYAFSGYLLAIIATIGPLCGYYGSKNYSSSHVLAYIVFCVFNLTWRIASLFIARSVGRRCSGFSWCLWRCTSRGSPCGCIVFSKIFRRRISRCSGRWSSFRSRWDISGVDEGELGVTTERIRRVPLRVRDRLARTSSRPARRRPSRARYPNAISVCTSCLRHPRVACSTSWFRYDPRVPAWRPRPAERVLPRPLKERRGGPSGAAPPPPPPPPPCAPAARSASVPSPRGVLLPRVSHQTTVPRLVVRVRVGHHRRQTRRLLLLAELPGAVPNPVLPSARAQALLFRPSLLLLSSLALFSGGFAPFVASFATNSCQSSARRLAYVKPYPLAPSCALAPSRTPPPLSPFIARRSRLGLRLRFMPRSRRCASPPLSIRAGDRERDRERRNGTGMTRRRRTPASATSRLSGLRAGVPSLA